MRVQRAAPLFPKILYGWWAQMLPPGGRQDGGSNLREEQEAEAQQPRLSLGTSGVALIQHKYPLNNG